MRATFIATIFTLLFIVAETIVGELSPSFKDWLKVVFYHHWIGKGVLAIAVFVLIQLIFYRLGEAKKLSRWIYATVGIGIISAATIFGFYVWEFLQK